MVMKSVLDSHVSTVIEGRAFSRQSCVKLRKQKGAIGTVIYAEYMSLGPLDSPEPGEMTESIEKSDPSLY